MKIEKAKYEDLEEIMPIYARAREFMQVTGNPDQWVDGYPEEVLLRDDIANGDLYICRETSGIIEAVFCFVIGTDPTYDEIYDGDWLNEEKYGVIHRIASAGRVKRVSDYCMAWCYDQVGNMRIDTHEDNKVMQDAVLRNGYERVGIIICHNGTPRVAFQKI